MCTDSINEVDNDPTKKLIIQTLKNVFNPFSKNVKINVTLKWVEYSCFLNRFVL